MQRNVASQLSSRNNNAETLSTQKQQHTKYHYSGTENPYKSMESNSSAKGKMVSSLTKDGEISGAAKGLF